MKHSVTILLMCVSFNTIKAQNLDRFNHERLDLTKKGMFVLGSWAGANIVISPILANSTVGSDKYFHQMNGYWNGINLLIAGFGYYTASKTNPNDNTLSKTLREQYKLEKTLLFNAGLDLAYIAGGFYLKERAENTTKGADRLKGFGESLVLQGGFLFAFDVVFYLVQKKHGYKLVEFIDNLAIHPSGFSVRLKI